MTKYYTSRDIANKYNILTDSEKNGILYEALDYMQAYNGRSKLLCIAMALGYENFEGESNTYTKKEKVNE